ncbi:hypothetical protein FGG08_003016 [Glutinoglossum americanum]|uniref:Chromo domain-containing protein n=1 Tax=Glutinoglossum americanum TaxID=1670608 RepID=A0A9P8IAK5_9PEZI|nr:hypothetical protein FGG08_003016 [Glutinoglossum americanum]
MDTGSDSDTISITSTAPSEQKDEYPVEAILAETVGDGRHPLYLVKWENYPITRATWEPASSFDDDSTLLDWKAKKDRQDKGFEPSFSIDEFQARIKEVENERARRKARRKAKRKRRGIPTSSDEGKAPVRKSRPKKRSTDLEEDEDEDGDGDESDVGEFRRDKRGSKKRHLSDEEGGDGLTSDDSLMQDIKVKEFNKKHKKLRKKPRARESRSSTEQAVSRPPSQPPSRPRQPPSRRPSTGTGTQGRQPIRRASEVSGHQTEVARPAAKATARRAPKVQAAKTTTNILANWNKDPPKRNLTKPDYKNPHITPQNPHLFNKLSILRRYEKASRNERPPQEGALQLFRPGDWNPRSLNKLQPSDSGPPKDRNEEDEDYEPTERGEGEAAPDPWVPDSGRAPHAASTQFRRPSQDLSLGRAPQAPYATHGGTHDATHDSSSGKFPQASGYQHRRPSQGIEPATPFLATSPTNSGAAVKSSSAHPQQSLDANMLQKPQVKKLTLAQYNQRNATSLVASEDSKEHGNKASTEDEKGGLITKDTREHLSDEEILREMEAINFTGAPENGSKPGRQQNTVSIPGVIAAVKIGTSKVEAGRLKLIGVPPELLRKWIDVVGSPLYLWLKKIVSADHFRRNREPNKDRVVGEGDVQGDFKSSPDELLELLHFYGGAGVYMNNHFIMVIYPTNVEAWKYMKQSSTSQLRWVAFTLDNSNDGSNLAWNSTNSSLAIKAAYKHLFKIQFSELLPVLPEGLQYPSKVPIFIMADTSAAWNETIILYKILKLSGATIYWSGQEGAWDYFTQRINFGILFLHNNYRRYGLATVPRLASIVNKHITIFEFGRLHHESTSKLAVTNRGSFGCRRLFPHGGCILLTDNMLMNDPRGSYEVIRVFKKRLEDSKSNTWKLVLRPGDVEGWCLGAIVSKANMDSEDSSTVVARCNIFQEISEFIYTGPENLHNNPDGFNIRQIAGDSVSGGNDALLQVQNLALWANSNCTKYRRFIAVNPTQNVPGAEDFPIVELMLPEQFIRKHAH